MSAPGSYQLGVDLGTTWTAAAIARDGICEMVGLGNRSVAIPSVVHQAHDGTTLTGDAADRRGPSEPLRVAREFKRRVGDPTPVLLGGTPYSAEALLGTLLKAVVARTAELEGGPPSLLTVTHPANWGRYKISLFEQVVQMAGVTATTMMTEPEAAAVAYAANERVEPGALIAVYDLGGGTFDTAVLRKTADGFAILGQPAGIDRLGGIDFDEAVIGHVRATLGNVLDRIDPTEPATLKALTRLRRDCIEAKEALSTDTQVTIPVLLPGVQSEVRLNRGEFEGMIRPTLDATISALRRTLAAAAVEPQEVSTVLLVGGSSRIPLVAELVSEAFDRPVAVDAHPKHTIALGAARAAALAETTTVDTRDARVIPFTAPPAGTGDTSIRGADTDVTADLSAVIAANIAERPASADKASSAHPPAATAVAADDSPDRDVTMAPAAPRHQRAPRRLIAHRALHDFGRVEHGTADGDRGSVAVAERPHLSWEAGQYDDIPDEIPDWLLEARQGNRGRSRRRWIIGLVTFALLSVLAIGAGAFMAREPTAEAYNASTPASDADPTGAATTDGTSADDETAGDSTPDDTAAASGGDAAATTAQDDVAQTSAGESSGEPASDGPTSDDTAADADRPTTSGNGSAPTGSGDSTSPSRPAPTDPTPTPTDDGGPEPPSDPEPTEDGGGPSEAPPSGGAAGEPTPGGGSEPPGSGGDVGTQSTQTSEAPVTSAAK